MNAPAKISPARDRYIMIVTHHLPTAEGQELALRCSLLLLRDQATSRMRDCSEEAYPALDHVQRLATQYAYQRMPLEELAELRRQLVMMTACASGLEMFAYRLSGGTDASGR